MSQLPRYESYKDSGVQWLGEIPSHWAVVRLDQGCEIVRGNTGFSKADLLEEGQYVALQYGRTYKVDEINNTFSSYVNEEFYKLSQIAMYGDTVLISTSETIEDLGHSCFYARQDIGLIGGEQFLLKVNQEEKLGKYLYYLSKAFSSYLRKYATGTKVYRFNTDHLKKIYIPQIPFNEQKVIADFLDKRLAQVDALIAKQKILLEKLAEQRVALISHAVTKGLNPDVEMKESRIRWVKDIPIHWNVVPVRYLFEFKNNQRIPVSAEDRGKMSEKIYPYYGASGVIDFVEDYIFDEDLLLVAEDGANLLSRSTPLAFKASGKYWVNNHAHIIKPLDNNLMYWEYVLALYDFTPLISGSAQPKLTKDNLASIKLPNPPDEEKRKICNFLDKPLENLKEQKLKIEKILETLKEYRSTLIMQVVTGKIDVRNLKVN